MKFIHHSSRKVSRIPLAFLCKIARLISIYIIRIFNASHKLILVSVSKFMIQCFENKELYSLSVAS
ncbi:hypothetical protein EI976_05210 [Bacillus licheniformis]|nr:hypothetical protein EI978_08100 [Bacillus licheniformis]KAA0821296.1 hypothetical protein EI973_19110 [Bacillus licheniformis]KAA0826444.1 hypothetical protein EI976_05210 [Bacillus licheniformis]